MAVLEVRDLPEINPGTGRPWVCLANGGHTCEGRIVGAVGAIPVCANGVITEIRRRQDEEARLAAWAEQNADLLAAEAAAEIAWESQFS